VHHAALENIELADLKGTDMLCTAHTISHAIMRCVGAKLQPSELANAGIAMMSCYGELHGSVHPCLPSIGERGSTEACFITESRFRSKGRNKQTG
jgi:hypothetical protein